ncbi:MAG: penicillin acylase family protein, partial [Anaerolineales bacterium]
MAWDLGGNLDSEIERAILTQAIGAEKTQEYMPLYPSDHPIIVPSPAVGAGPLTALRQEVRAVDNLLGARFDGIGSNNWVIAGSRTTTGLPLLANDPHLSLQMPSIWYEIGLHCQPVSAACGFDVTGYSFAGVPAVVIGHNARIAWGFTNVGPDVEDLYIEKINPSNANQYEVNGAWVDMTVAQDVIKVKGGGSEPLTIRSTRHGPIITDVYGLENFATQAGLGAANPYGLALRWTALEPGHLFRAIFKMNRAQNWDEFRAAIPDFDAPAQNIVYADVDGNIGYQTPGHIPIRKGGDGLTPVPGWTDDYEWTGYIPFDELPYAYNPPQGYIATANNAVVGPDYPHPISLEWDAGYRAQRIVAMIEATPKLSIADIQKIQGDDLNLGAQEVLPSLLALSFDDAKLSAAAGQLRGWDGQMTIDSAPAAIYMSFFNRLLSDTFDDDLPADYWPSGGDNSWVTVRNLLAKPDSAWWDNTQTPAVEGRDDILRQAFSEGYADLVKRLGSDPNGWAWGKLHTATFENLTLGRSGIGPIEKLFNRGPFAVAGGPSIVNATGFNLSRDDSDTSVDPFAEGSGPSMRMIVDLSNLDNSLAIHTTGESGHAYAPHYADMSDRWRLIQYHPMLWSRSSVEANSDARLTLTP